MDLIGIIKENWRAGVEVLVLWILIYQTYRVFRATRGARILVGLTVVIILMTLASQTLDLKVIEWIIKSAAAVLAFALLIIFQPELRNGLARLGSTNLFSFSTSQQKIFLDALTEAVMKLSKKRFGALFAIERGIELSEYESTGVVIDSALSVELVATVFHPLTDVFQSFQGVGNWQILSSSVRLETFTVSLSAEVAWITKLLHIGFW